MKRLYAIQLSDGRLASWTGDMPMLWTKKKGATGHLKAYPKTFKGAKVVPVEIKVIA